jgi:hypothetical protein
VSATARLIGELGGWEPGSRWYYLSEPFQGCPCIVIVQSTSGQPSNQPQIARAHVYPATDHGTVPGESMEPAWVSGSECTYSAALAAVGYDFDPTAPPSPPKPHVVYRVPTVEDLPADPEDLGVYAVDDGERYAFWSDGWRFDPWIPDARALFGVELVDVPLRAN